MIRALVVDDHPSMRRAVCRLLERSGDMEVVGEADNGARALEEIDRLAPDVVLLDIRMPLMDGFAVLEALKAKRWSPIVVVLTVNDDIYAKAKALAEGAHAFVPKRLALIELLPAIRKVLKR